MKKQDVLYAFLSILSECPESVTYPEKYRLMIGLKVYEKVEDLHRYRDILTMPSEEIPNNEIRLVEIKGVRYL